MHNLESELVRNEPLRIVNPRSILGEFRTNRNNLIPVRIVGLRDMERGSFLSKRGG